jgi:hypothetical protein
MHTFLIFLLAWLAIGTFGLLLCAISDYVEDKHLEVTVGDLPFIFLGIFTFIAGVVTLIKITFSKYRDKVVFRIGKKQSLFLILGALSFLMGCGPTPPSVNTVTLNPNPPTITASPMKNTGIALNAAQEFGIHRKPLYEFEFEGCQYLLLDGFKEACITHKGNCTNKIHQGE